MGNRVVYDKNAQYPGESGLSFNPKTGRFDYDPKIGYTEDYQSIAGKIARTVGPALVANAMGPMAPAAGAMIAKDLVFLVVFLIKFWEEMRQRMI